MLDLGEFFNNITGKIAGKDSVLVSPIWTAVIISLLLMIILFFVIYEEIELKYEESSIVNLAFRVGLWGFVGSLILAFLRNSALNAKYIEKYKSHGQHQLVDKIVDNANLEGLDFENTRNENSGFSGNSGNSKNNIETNAM